MRLAKITFLLVAAAGLLQAGCGDSDSGSATGAADRAPSAEEIEVGALLAEIRGLYRVAAERYEAGDAASAADHAQHPPEVVSTVGPDLEQMAPGSSEELERAVRNAAAAAGTKQPASEVQAALDAATRATATAEREAMGETANSDAYRGSLIARLLSTAAHEYEEAVADNRVRQPVEYEEAFGFLGEAAAMYRAIAGAVAEKSAAEKEEIDEAFTALQQALPSGDPPRRPAPLEEVERNATLIGAELEETVGAIPEAQSDPQEVSANIEKLLDEVIATYDPANPQAAAELVAEAYLENYETIEGAVIEAAPDINEQLEPLLGAELRKRIREGAPVAEIRAMVARAKELLAQGVAAVEKGG